MAFLKIDKDLFKLKLNPTEILVLAQVMEFDRNAVCYMTDAQFAENFGVSAKTISRALDSLETKGLIVRETKTVASKRVRTISPTSNGQNDCMKKDTNNLKRTICPTETDNLSISNGQNDFIKEKEKINEKEKEAGLFADAKKSLSGAKAPLKTISEDKNKFEF